jgi:hypothetical protein
LPPGQEGVQFDARLVGQVHDGGGLVADNLPQRPAFLADLVVLHQVALGDAVAGEQHLGCIGQLDGHPAGRQHLAGHNRAAAACVALI